MTPVARRFGDLELLDAAGARRRSRAASPRCATRRAALRPWQPPPSAPPLEHRVRARWIFRLKAEATA